MVFHIISSLLWEYIYIFLILYATQTRENDCTFYSFEIWTTTKHCRWEKIPFNFYPLTENKILLCILPVLFGGEIVFVISEHVLSAQYTNNFMIIHCKMWCCCCCSTLDTVIVLIHLCSSILSFFLSLLLLSGKQ